MYTAQIKTDDYFSINHCISVYVETLTEAENYVKGLLRGYYHTEHVCLYYIDDLLYNLWVDGMYTGTVEIKLIE